MPGAKAPIFGRGTVCADMTALGVIAQLDRELLRIALLYVIESEVPGLPLCSAAMPGTIAAA